MAIGFIDGLYLENTSSGIRAHGPELLNLLEKVERVHGEAHPELHELKMLVSESLQDLEMHLQKEENVLFPYLYDLYAAFEQGQRMEPMHCGTIANPIRVMKMEHEGEGNRYLHIIELTDHFLFHRMVVPAIV